jgi:hypothetical protein
MESAADARLEIEEALTVSVVEAPSAVAAPAAASGHVAWIITVVAALVAAGLAFVHFREPPPAAPSEMRLDIVTPATGDPVSFALSPDGKQIVYVGYGVEGVLRLWLRPLASATAQPLSGTEGASFPFWSPDSRSIGFFAGGQLRRLDIGGGQPQPLANATAAAARGGTWNADGIILFALNTATSVFRVSATGGEAVPITIKLDKQTSPAW